MILGLDVSSSMIGIALIDKNGNLIKQSKIQLNKAKIKDEYDKIDIIKSHLQSEYKSFPISKIRVEAPLAAFGRGKSTAATLAILNRFNGITCALLYQIFAIKPELVYSATARKKCKVVITSKETVKQDVLRRVLDICPAFVLEYTRQKNYVPGTYDMADAFVVAYSGL